MTELDLLLKLSEEVLAEAWLREEEDEAWEYLNVLENS